MKVLCVYTNKYPYTTVEPYLESEVLHYSGFDKVYIFSLIVKKSEEKQRRATPNNIEVFPIRNDKLRYILGSVRVLFDTNFYQEIRKLKRESKISLRRIITLLIYISRSHVDSKKICRLMKGKLRDSENIFYTYRFEFQPYTALLVKQKLHLEETRVVSRAHGYDLYEERSAGEYIPLRGYILEHLDKVFPCSKAGENYLQKKYPMWVDKITTRYLGTNDYGVEEYRCNDLPFRIVSCSNVIKIKRLDRIVEVLSRLENKKIEWIHFGSGEEEDVIKRLAAEKLSENISIVFKGRVQNVDIMKFYVNNKIDLFINLSDGEGLPVSIMEAFSVGIPCVATNVGGTSEIVSDGLNGFLVDATDTDDAIAAIVAKITNMDEDAYCSLRVEARKTWERKFDAEKNYREFNRDLLKLTL